ncbi:hypothetical protein GGTG_07813 [Gaeumannomyces tritici R3-111a-1]|uniref:Uncharacterized protein n=1 Tax=Gaeumannomyces tritici (strain R3-111a-1) TaxID=644352 RepID=J3P2R9_GAET3|nr:hypothetical protein GGTG_07813 [Gaeumannomyces tritici R3-111a-1]EJT73961.1 hypothetical protein GGTG_07813 [Gaeumannomyces tritici R3-111a-1]
MDGYYHPDGKRAGAMDADGGYFLDEDVREFDNDVLGLNNLEATHMDPQQRKLLEVTYECLESAGLSMESAAGSDTAVYRHGVRWMMSRAARHFIFLGRSGRDKPEAQALVAKLRAAGASVEVVRGDVCSQGDVDAAVNACSSFSRPIGGVIQAAMGLDEALFSRMSHGAWHAGVRPKWQGSWNLDRSLARGGRDADLDFFLLTSSVSGSVGTATESNYCSANGFLDAFARHRRGRGKPAVSVGLGMISEVGYLHENPEIEALLLHKGIQPLSEGEFPQVVDLALAPPGATDDDNNNNAPAHILTGLEPFDLRGLIRRGFAVESDTTQDPRCGFLAAALFTGQQANSSSNGSSSGKGVDGALDLATPAWLKALPHFGLDSMIAAEYRTWFWTVLKVDVPFLDLMSPKTPLAVLAGFVGDKIAATWKRLSTV